MDQCRTREIPGWPGSTAVGHAGKLIIGKVGDLDVAVMAGRVHLYEGYSPAQVTYRRPRVGRDGRALHGVHQRRGRHQPVAAGAAAWC